MEAQGAEHTVTNEKRKRRKSTSKDSFPLRDNICIMVKPSNVERRVSDHGAAKAWNHVERDRRRTMGAFPANLTPSKHQVNLGSSAASAYFFGDTAKTPHSTTKKHRTPAKTHASPYLPMADSNLDETVNFADVSMLSAGTSSSEGSDMLNKSILSDTTELTASNFVLQASSRQRLFDLARSSKPSAMESENIAPNTETDQLLSSPGRPSKPADKKHSSLKPLDSGAAGTPEPSNNTTSEKSYSQGGFSSSSRSPLSASPSSLRKLAASIREEKEQNASEKARELKFLSLGGSVRWSIGSDQQQQTNRSSRHRNSVEGISLLLPPLTPASEHMTTSQKESPFEVLETPDASKRNEAAIAISAEKSLENLLRTLKEDDKLMESQEMSTKTASSEQAQGGDTSPSSTIISTSGVGFLLPSTPSSTPKLNSIRPATPYPREVDAMDTELFHSPSSTKVDDESHFRLTPGCSRKSLNPSKLSPSPRRVPNPDSMDSPARNTRGSKQRATTSPLNTSMDIDSMQESVFHEENTGEKRKRDGVHEAKIVSAFMSLRPTGRVSEITMPSSISSKVKRSRRSSISLAESMRSTSTASTTDLNELLGTLETEKEFLQEKPGGFRSVLPSPALADASIPRSILSSSRRSLPGSHSKKSVAFGSPQAAEYRIGSPSVSLTPMPRETARAMFSMSSVHGSCSSSSTASPEMISNSLMENEDDTVEIEMDMSELLQNITTTSENMSMPNEGETEEVKKTLEGLRPTSRDNSSSASETALNRESPRSEDETVELEPNLQGFLSANFGSPTNESMLLSDQKKSVAEAESSPAGSVDMADAESIASFASRAGDKDSTSEASPQRLDFDSKSSQPSVVIVDTVSAFGDSPDDQNLDTTGLQGNEEDNTIELDADLSSLLAANDGGRIVAPKPVTEASLQRLDFDSKPSQPPVYNEDTVSAFGDGPDDRNLGTSGLQGNEQDNTVELEADLSSLLATNDGGRIVAPEPVTEANLQRPDFDSKSSHPSVHNKDTVSAFGDGPDDRSLGTSGLQGNEEDNTVELEADLSSLLAANGGGRRVALKPVTLTKKFPKLESSLVQRTNRLSFGEVIHAPSPSRMSFGETMHAPNSHPMSFGETIHAPNPLMTNENTTEGQAYGNGDDDMTEENVTKELEITDTPSASRRRSSHRFSLTPGSRRLSLSTDGSIAVDDSAIDIEAHDRDENYDREPHQDIEEENTVLDLDSKEIMEAAGLPQISAMHTKNNADTLASANTASKHFRNPLIADAMNEFAFAVCVEIEKKAELSSDGNSCFAAIADDCPNQLLQLQKALRSLDGKEATKSKKELRRLAQCVQAFVEFEWEVWEVQVVESLAKAVDGIALDFDEFGERLESCVTLADDALEAVSFMEGRAVQRARRRSMLRRKTTSQGLAAEIKELEDQITRERSALELLHAKQHTATSFQKVFPENVNLFEELKQSRALAETLQSHFMSINGMHCWSPLIIDESKIIVGFIGASPKTCIKVSFLFAKSGTVTCLADVDSSLFRRRRGKQLKVTPATSRFVQANIAMLVDSVNNKILASGRSIGEMLQRLEMLHGRLEMTANELFALQKRYGTMLEVDAVGSKSDFLLSVNFTSLRGSMAMQATFELNTLYPFAPLNVSLDDREGKVDVDLLRRQLVKNAKPGFGYLSRTCDTISAFLR